MSRAKIASTVPLLTILGFLFWNAKKKAESIAPAQPMNGLGKFHFSAPKLTVKSVLKTAINPVAQIKVAQSTFAKNKFMNDAMNAAKTIANPIMQVKKTKEALVHAAHSKSGITHWALVASDPIQQQRAMKSIMAKKKKHGGQEQETPATEASLFPYQVEPGIWIDKDGNRINQDGTAYVEPVAVSDPGIDSATGQPPIYYGDNLPSNDVDGGPAPLNQPATDPNAPYFDNSSGLWYYPPEDLYYDAETGQVYDGYLNPIDANGNRMDSESKSYADQPQTDMGPKMRNAIPSGMIVDPNTGFIYDYATDTYFDAQSAQYYDGYYNPIDSSDQSLQGLGALGKFKFHIAKSAPLKAAAIVGAVAAIVGCIYASGGCAAYVGADAALASYAWRKSKPNPQPTTAIATETWQQQQQQRQQEAQLQSQEPYYDTNYNMWYDPKSNQYYDPQTHTVYNPSQPVARNLDANGFEPTQY